MWSSIIAQFSTQIIGAVFYNPSVLGTTYYKALKLKPREITIVEWILVTITAWLEVAAVQYILTITNPQSLKEALENTLYAFVVFVVSTQAVHFPFDQRPYKVLAIYVFHHFLLFFTNTIILFSLQY